MSIDRKPTLIKTFEEWFKTEGGVVLKNFSEQGSIPDSDYEMIYSKGGKLYTKTENNIEGRIYSKNEINFIEQLENSLAEICWYYYSEPKYLSNLLTDNYDNETAIASLLSDYQYDPVNDWIEPSLTGATYIADVSLLQDIERWDAKGDIETWQSTEPDDTKGYFAPSGETGSWPNVSKGCMVLYSGGSSDIINYTGGGNQTDEVEIDSGITDNTNIDAIYGITVSSGNITSNTAAGSGETLHDIGNGDLDSSLFFEGFGSIRVRIDKDDITGSSSRIQVQLWSPYYSGSNTNIEKVSIGPADSEGPSCITTPTEITDFDSIQLSGADAFVATISAAFDYNFDSTTHHILTVDINTDSNCHKSYPGQNGSYWLKSEEYTYDQASVTGFFETSGYELFRIVIIGEGEGTPATEPHTAISSSLMEINTSSWDYISQIIGSQSTPGSSTLYHMVCFNKGASDEKWKIYSTDWRDAVKLDSGTWKYQDASDIFQNASNNTRLDAIAEAFDVSSNQMGISVLQQLGRKEFDEVFSSGSMNFAWNIDSNLNEIVTFDKYTIYYNSNPNISLITEDLEAKENDPLYGFVIMKIKPVDTITVGTHIKADISIDDGTNWEEVTLTTYKTEGDYSFIRGIIYNITARGDKTVRCRIRTSNLKDIKIKSCAVGVR